MRDGDILILTGGEVGALLAGREAQVVDAVRRAYLAHSRGESSLPHSSFLRFPAAPNNRVIALPAYLGGEFGAAGIKWIASFPGNLERGLDRASAAVILNSAETGRPFAFMEGSVISARRTAASAALAALGLRAAEETDSLSIVGCGPINFEVVRFVLGLLPDVGRLHIYDTDPARAQQFSANCRRSFGGLEVSVARAVEPVLESSPLISIATTAAVPHIGDLSRCRRGSTILHVSLRDLSAEAILASDNVVDDVDHVCRAQTSVHLAEQLSGGRDFIRCTLADVLLSRSRKPDPDRVTVFSPFGLGVLDLAVALFAYQLSLEQKVGTVVESFLPTA